MRQRVVRWAPFILTGALLLNLVNALLGGGRANWLLVTVVALMLALTLWWRARTTP